MKLTGSGVYTRAAPVPTLPAGIMELMEGLTKDVLRHNPPNVYEFCANHMAKLLEIRDGRAPKHVLTLEEKIAKAQQKIRERAEQRRQKYDQELKQQSQRNDVENALDRDNISVAETTLENNLKAPIHHEQDLTDALEVEIFHEPNDIKKNEDEPSIKVKEDTNVEGKEEKLHVGTKYDKTTNEFNGNNITAQENSIIKQKKNSVETMLTKAVDIFENPTESVSEYSKKGSIDNFEANIENAAILCDGNIDQITEVIAEKTTEHTSDGVKPKVDNIIDDSMENPKNIVETSQINSDQIVAATIKRVDALVDSVENKVDAINEKLDNTVEITEAKVDKIIESTSDNYSNFADTTIENVDEFSGLTVQQINSTVEPTKENVVKIINEHEKNISNVIDATRENNANVVDRTDMTGNEINTIADANEQKLNNVVDISTEKIKFVGATTEHMAENIVNTDEQKAKSNTDATKERVDSAVDGNITMDDNDDIEKTTNSTEIEASNFIDTITVNKAEIIEDSTKEKDENTINLITEIVSDVEKLTKGAVDVTEKNVLFIAEKKENDVEDTITEKNDVPDVTSQTIDNVQNTLVENVDVINDTIEQKLGGDDGKQVENVLDTDEEKIENLVNIKKTDEKIENACEQTSTNNVDANGNQVEKIKNNMEKENNVLHFAEATFDDPVKSIEENVDEISEIKSCEKNYAIENNAEQYQNSKQDDLDVNDDKKLHDNGNKIELDSPKKHNRIEKETQDRSNGHTKICDIAIPIHTKNNGTYVEIYETPFIQKNVIELTMIENGNRDNDAANEITSKTNEEIDSKGNVFTPELITSLNNEDASAKHHSKQYEENSDAAEYVSNISEPEQLEIDITSIGKHSSMDDSTIEDSNDSILELDTMKNVDEVPQNIHSPNTMDLETAAVTIQKVFRTFLFKSRSSTFDDTANNEVNLNNDDSEKEEADLGISSASLSKERRALGISRMDTVLQTVNEEKSLSLSTDDSSTLSSAATIIQAHVRGFLVRNKLNFNKTNSSTSIVNSDEQQSLEIETDQQKKNKTVLNIHIVPEGEHFLSRDESMITSMDLSLDGSPPTSTNLHPLGYNKNERRKQLKREDAIQSMSPPSNNSGKLSEEVDSVKDMLINDTSDQEIINNSLVNEAHQDTNTGSDTSSNKSITMDTVIEAQKYIGEIKSVEAGEGNSTVDKRKRLKKISSDEGDVVTPFVSNEDKYSLTDSENTSKLLHSGEFHDVVLPTKVSRTDTSVVRVKFINGYE